MEAKKLIEHGEFVRGITDIAYADIAPAQEILDIGEDLRHYDGYGALYLQW